MPGSPNSLDSLKKTSVRGGTVAMLSQAVSVSLQLASILILARVLSPNDYGVLSMVMAVTGFAELFRDLGLSSAAIQKKDLTHIQQSSLFWINVATGLVLTLIVASISPLVAIFYGMPELREVTMILSLTFVIGAFGSQHSANLIRQIRYKQQAYAKIGSSLVGLCTSLALAINGFGYWSLVWGTLATSATNTILLTSLSSFTPSSPWQKNQTLGSLVRFGIDVTAFDLINYLSRNLDNILIGKYWGAGALGIYSRAYKLLMFPIINLRGPITSIAYPALSKLDHTSRDFRNYYLNLSRTLAMVTMPLMAFLCVNATPVITLVLGQNWIASAEIFMVLALVGFIQPVSTLRGLIMLSSGNSKRNLRSVFITTPTVICAFFIGIHHGPLGVAISYTIAVWALVQPMHQFCSKGTAVQKGDLFLACRTPSAAAVTAATANLILLHLIGSLGSELQIALGVFVFSAISICFYRTSPDTKRITSSILRSVSKKWQALRRRGARLPSRP